MIDTQTVTMPAKGSLVAIRNPLPEGAKLTSSTGVMEFTRVQHLLSKNPLRKPRLEVDDVEAARRALSEPGDSLPYDVVRNELDLDGSDGA
jgi:hypothetical protein